MKLPNIYVLLNKEAKTWWYHIHLRTQGQIAEARRLERKSIKNSVRHIRKALECKTGMTIRDHGYTLQMGSDGTLSGYGNLFNDPFVQACYKAGVKITDERSAFERGMN